MSGLRIPIRVKPGASRARVGGCHGEDELIVAVNAAPVDGAANDAVVTALAKALGVRSRQVTIVRGHTARSKVLEIDVDDAQRAEVTERLKALLA